MITLKAIKTQDELVGQLIKQKLSQKGFGTYKQAGEALSEDLGHVIGINKATCCQYVASLCGGDFYIGTPVSYSRTRPLMLRRLSLVMHWLGVPQDDPIMVGIKNLYPDFSKWEYPPEYIQQERSSRKGSAEDENPTEQQSGAVLSLEERVRLLQPRHKQIVGHVVDALLETYKPNTQTTKPGWNFICKYFKRSP